jgi:type VI secretion system protein ImpF
MPDLTPKERLQPALLDRLRDEDPEKKVESRDKRIISARELYEYVKRDLSWLLNTVHLECADGTLEGYPWAQKSVINYGIPELCGHTLRTADLPMIQRSLREAILRFEPRVVPRSLEVDVRLDDSAMSHNRLTFEIRGDLWAYPIPLELLIRTEVDLETGDVTVVEGGG